MSSYPQHYRESECLMLTHLDCSLKTARAYTDGDCLVVTTGCFRRVWKWTGAGFATSEIADPRAGLSWGCQPGGCDWQLPDGTEAGTATLRTLSARPADDEGFTSGHVAVTAEIAYPGSGITLLWTVWVYPGAPGVRTQLAARSAAAPDAAQTPRPQGSPPDGRVERIPLGGAPSRRRFFGYYNETQQRNDTHQDLLKEEVIDHPLSYREWCDWASAACVENDAGGVALVKESHKCVNQPGHATGGFVCDEAQGLSCTGWGMRPEEISTSAFTPGWATWCLAWPGGDLGRETAFKTFDQIRYPVDPERDVYIQANTWGSTDNGRDARRAATEDSVMEELDACAELGIDVLQIDDGWQVPPGHETWEPGDNGWRPHPQSYPQGWTGIRSRAAQLGVRLGLWAAATPISLDELKASFSEGGFTQYKLDFAVLRRRAEIDALMQKVREFMAWTGHRVRVNWDVTENPPRYGYFFAREYGCLYLENRKPVRPKSVVYRPHTVLRDIWQAAKYLNIHRVQCSIQNVDRVDPGRSDAHLHPHAYATAIALIGIPLFFLETKYYSPAARAEIRALLGVYKEHRLAMSRGMVHPVGSTPDNASWTGFQCHLADACRGYLIVFRERCCAKARHALELGWLRPGPVDLEDIVAKRTWRQDLAADGTLSLAIDDAPGFLFLHYRAEK